jgi:hypothetical protein
VSQPPPWGCPSGPCRTLVRIPPGAGALARALLQFRAHAGDDGAQAVLEDRVGVAGGVGRGDEVRVLGDVGDVAGADVNFGVDGASPGALALQGRAGHVVADGYRGAGGGGGGAARLAELLRSGRGRLLVLDAPDSQEAEQWRKTASGWADRVEVTVGTCAAAPSRAVLVRPDGFVAWTAESEQALEAALERWFGLAE